MSEAKEIAYSVLFGVAVIIMIIAFQPKEYITDDNHFLLRQLSETLFCLFVLLITHNYKYLHMVVMYGFLLSLNSLYDEALGNPLEFSFIELSFAVIITIFFYNKITTKWIRRKSDGK